MPDRANDTGSRVAYRDSLYTKNPKVTRVMGGSGVFLSMNVYECICL